MTKENESVGPDLEGKLSTQGVPRCFLLALKKRGGVCDYVEKRKLISGKRGSELYKNESSCKFETKHFRFAGHAIDVMSWERKHTKGLIPP